MNEQVEEIYCKIDTALASTDYGESRSCIRLIGIKENEFLRLANEPTAFTGFTTFTLDIGTDVVKRFGLHTGCCRCLNEWCSEHIWYRVRIAKRDSAAYYLYETFSESPPQYLEVLHITKFDGPSLPAPSGPTCHRTTDTTGNYARKKKARYRFSAFHVGQGMCCLVHNKYAGILLDAGAGKPVTRDEYIAGRIVNELSSVTKRLKSLDAVVSHAHSDHWRLLAWDTDLRHKVARLFVPAGVAKIALLDKAIIKKVIYTADRRFSLTPQTRLRILRSAPKPSDGNGECLVSVFEQRGKRALAPGDYVYSRFGSDDNAAIQSLHDLNYTTVIVPHHGDAASAKNLVRAQPHATAFFSAGTHRRFKHPANASLDAHAKQYKNIVDKTLAHIVQVRLI